MKYKAITTQQEYDEIATRIEELQDVAPNTEEAKELKALMKLLVAYETKRQAAAEDDQLLAG